MEIKRRANVTCSYTTRASPPKGRRVANKKSTPFKRTKLLYPTTIACSKITFLLSLFTPTSTTEAYSSISSATVKVDGEAKNAKHPITTSGPPEAVLVSDNPYTNCSLLGLQECNQTNFWENGGIANNTDNHEYQYLYDVPVYLVVLLSLLYGVISVAAVIGNLLVLWVVTVSRRMRTKTNMFIANLALADIMIAIFAIPFQFQAALLQRWNLPDFMCAFCPFVQRLLKVQGKYTADLALIGGWAFTMKVVFSTRTWLIALPNIFGSLTKVSLLEMLWVIELNENGIGKPFCAPVSLSETFRIYYIYSLVVIQYILPLLIISVAYARMATRLWGTNTPGNKEESRDENTLRNKKKRKRMRLHFMFSQWTRLLFTYFMSYYAGFTTLKSGWAAFIINCNFYQFVKMLAVVVLLFALCWLPLQMYNFFQTITAINEYQYINIIWFCFHWLAMSNSCYNPFIYAIYSDKFQTEFKSRLHCLRMRTREPEDTYCSEASDFEMSRARVVPARLSRAGRFSSKGTIRISNIEAQRVSDVDSSNDIKPAPAPTISKTVQNAENELESRSNSPKSETS